MANSIHVGNCRIGGELLEQMKELKPGEVLRLTAEDGKSYGLFNWVDATVLPSPQNEGAK